MKITASQKWLACACAGLLGSLAAACSSSTGGGGGGGTGTTTATATSTGSDCHGDQATWDSLTKEPIPCQTNSDCCVIVLGCLSEVQVVAATNKDQAKAVWPYCGPCNACIPPPTVVSCDKDTGTCTAATVDFADAGPDLMQDHCGKDTDPVLPPMGLHFGCGSP